MLKLLLRRWGVIPKFSVHVEKPTSFPYYLLRLEALAVLLVSLWVYFFVMKSSWLLFLLLVVTPDLSLLTYAFGLQIGGIMYDLFHIYFTPSVLIVLGLVLDARLLIDIGLIWVVHIAQDRMRGFGLKYLDRYGGSHLHKL